MISFLLSHLIACVVAGFIGWLIASKAPIEKL